MSPQKKTVPAGELSLPSFRDGISFKVRPLNFGGVKAMLRAEKAGAGDMVSVMIMETIKREFPNTTEREVDNLEQADFIKLLELVTDANKGLSEMDFTPPTTTGS
jgi:hypothetical protein